MLRDLGGAAVGYFLMFLVIAAVFMGAWQWLGASFAFRPGTTETTAGWILLELGIGFVAAYLGGWAAARIGGSGRAPRLLALILLALGAAQALWALAGHRPPVSAEPESLSAIEAAAVAIQPLWALLLLPLVEAGGALVGGVGRR